MTERRLGRIVRLQIQRSIIKHKGICYDPAGLATVEEAEIGPQGITGLLDGARVMDVHHADHPSGRGGGHRMLSIGFTGHYGLMDDRFGDVPVGIAGENLITDCPGRLFEDDLEGTVVIRAAAGEIELRGARVAAPCREFASFLLGRAALADREEIAGELAFLGDGLRGFILDGSALAWPMPVCLGDEVVLRV
jgi:hypothetical protein